MMKSSTNTGVKLAMGVALAMSTTGCEQLFETLVDKEENTIVNVFATHHATPEDGVVPDRGGQGQSRVFETDEGWTATLAEGFVVTRSATLYECDGTAHELEFYSGAITEDLNAADLGLTTLGGVELSGAELCGMTVVYAPFAALTDAAPRAADREDLDGATVLLRGFAQKGEEMASFEIRVEDRVEVDLDLVELTGGPVEVKGDERFPLEMTLSKTYDRFFDGIDFSDMSSLDMRAQTRAVLELETRVATGTVIGG